MKIEISFATQDKNKIFRIWIFGEDLSLKLRETDLAHLPMNEVDRATIFLSVRVKSRQKVRRTVAIIKEVLKKHNLLDDATLTTVN
ncbi:MAG: hypothetical protein ACTHN2_13645 [Nitrobacter sp.]|jgi:ribosomal 50S subunit-associated protein YjgA (DUF615 family)